MEYKKVQQGYFDTANENFRALAKLFPSVVKDGEIDFEALKEELGQFTEVGKEKYELTWAGKQNAKRLVQQDAVGRTLKYIPEDSKNPETTQNLYIEGDNLEILKVLRKNYYNSIKMIYIDPPYNTGNDFVFKDSFLMEKDESDLAEGLINDSGERLTINSKSSNRFHANWLSMMYPRLRIAKDLLTDDGVIFISIGDHEIANLRAICDEIFDQENFQGHIHWRRRHNQPNDKTKMIGLVAEHILAYSKNHDVLRMVGVGKVDLTGDFSNPDNDPRGDWATKPWKVGSGQSGSKYVITSPSGDIFDEEWMGEENTYKELLADNRIIFPNGGRGFPRKKYFRFERQEEGQCATNWWEHKQFGHNQGASALLTSLFGVKNLFSNPKPIELIRGLIQISNAKKDDIILDFFAGSSSTAHAVMAMNAEQPDLQLRYIMVQVQEDLDKSILTADSKAKKVIQNCINYLDTVGKPHLLTEFGKQRILKAAKQIKDSYKGIEGIERLDTGFKVFRTANTNIRWVHDTLNHEHLSFDASQLSEKDQIDFMPHFTDLDVVYEVMLRQRDIPLSSKIQKLEEIGDRSYIFADSYVVCLEEKITEKMVDALAAIEPLPIKYVFRDSAFEDDIALKDETFRRLRALISRNTGETKATYTVEFI